MMSDHGTEWLSDAVQYVLAGGAGVTGHIMYQLHLLQKGERKPWWWIAAGMTNALIIGWIVIGIGDWFHVPFKASQSLSIIAGWGGPRLLDKAIAAAIRKYLGKTDEA